MKSGAALDQEPHVVRVNFRILVEVGRGRDDLADLGVGQRLEDGLHVAHRTPHVHRVAATVGVAHDEVPAAARCRTTAPSNTPAPCRWWPGRDPDGPGRFAARMMFQLSSADGSTGPSAFSTSAGSAAEGSSPYSARGLAPAVADSGAVVATVRLSNPEPLSSPARSPVRLPVRLPRPPRLPARLGRSSRPKPNRRRHRMRRPPSHTAR